MTEKKRNILMPLYFKEFQCVGGSCEDNCCIGWDVEIDKKTYQKYKKVEDSELSKLFRNLIYKNPDSYDDNVDYAIVELERSNKCPFLNEKHLCKIQAKLGHSFLSNVCGTYPRYSNEINGVIEYSANISCPFAARLILTNEEGIRFSEEVQEAPSNIIINCDIDTRKHGGNLMVKYFIELRNFTISMLQNRKYPLRERVLILGHFYEELEKELQQRKDVNIPKHIEAFIKKTESGKLKSELSSASADYSLQLKMVREITEKVNRTNEIDSEKYKAFAKEFLKGLGISEKSKAEAEGKAYKKAYEDFYSPFMKNHEYILENYLVNFVFGGLFPVAESTKPFESYMMLVIRYALIKSSLIGISAFRKGLTTEDCVRFIQVFSKAIEHNYTYLQDIMLYMDNKRYNTLSSLETLLKN